MASRVTSIVAALGLLAVAACAVAPHASAAEDRPNAVVLVARPDLPDPNFRETVVLVTRHSHGGTVGVILNRPTRVRLAEVFRAHEALARRPDLLFSGGPVSPATLVLVLRSADRPASALVVLDDVYMSLDPGLVDSVMSRPDDREFRIYAGYAGWAPAQLEVEIHRRDWHVLDEDVETIFRGDPATMWRTLLRRATSQSVEHMGAPTWPPIPPPLGHAPAQP